MLHWIEMGETRFMDDFKDHDELKVLKTFMAGVTQSGGDFYRMEEIAVFIEVSTQIITQHCEFLLNLLNVVVILMKGLLYCIKVVILTLY